MEFKFAVNDIFKEPIVEINHNLVPPGFSGDRRALWDTVGKVSEVVNAMGEASAGAQGLTKPITTAERLRNSEHKIYLLIDQHAGHGRGAITGMLKIGKKGLYVFDRNGQHFQVSPNCVLDFYVHESRQRTGLGKRLFEHMLQNESVEPVKMAIDRPSEKFLGFLKKHYGLNNPIKQMNNYVVFDHFFPSSNSPTPEKNGTPVENNNSGSALGKKQSANGLQSASYNATPLGRYGAPRPVCSMGQIIHNQTSTIQATPEPVGTRSAPDTHYQSGGGNFIGYTPANPANVVQSAPNIYYSSPASPGQPQTQQEMAANYQNQNVVAQHQQENQYQIDPSQQQLPQQQYQQQPNQYKQQPNQYQVDPNQQRLPQQQYQQQPSQYQVDPNQQQLPQQPYQQLPNQYQSNVNVAYQQQPEYHPQPQVVDANSVQMQNVSANQAQNWQQPTEPLIPAIPQSAYAANQPVNVQNVVESQNYQPSQAQINVAQSVPNTAQYQNVQNYSNQHQQSMQMNMPQTQSVPGFQNTNNNAMGQSQHNFAVENVQYQHQQPSSEVAPAQSAVGIQQQPQQYVAPNMAASQQNVAPSPQYFQMAEAPQVAGVPESPQYAPVIAQSNFVNGEAPKVSDRGDMKPEAAANEDEYHLRYGYPPQVQNSTTAQIASQ